MTLKNQIWERYDELFGGFRYQYKKYIFIYLFKVYITVLCRFFGKLANLLTQLHYLWISLTRDRVFPAWFSCDIYLDIVKFPEYSWQIGKVKIIIHVPRKWDYKSMKITLIGFLSFLVREIEECALFVKSKSYLHITPV